MVTCLMTAVWEDAVRISLQAVVFTTTAATMIYSLRHGLHTLTAVPRLTELPPCMVMWVSAFGLSNNKWRWWMWMVSAYCRNHSRSRLDWSEGWQPPGAHSAFISWTGWTFVVACHDDSTINIMLVIIIMVTLWNRADHYIFILFLSSFFFYFLA